MSIDVNAPTLISARGLSAGYGPHRVVCNVTFELPEGETLVLMGPGGSGKTTLLRALGSPTTGEGPWIEGELRVAGRPRLACRQKPRLGPASLRQLLAELGKPTEAVEGPTPSELLESTWGCAHEVVDFLIPALDEPLTGAGRDLLALSALSRLAVAARRQPGALLLVDEPTAEVSARADGWLTELLDELGARHTMILVTHDQRLARRLADEVMLLAAGRLIETAPVADFFERPREPRTSHFVRMGS